MDDRTWDRVIEILEADPEFFVPVKKLWLMLHRERRAPDMTIDEFYTQLAGDPRIEVMEGDALEEPDLGEVEAEELDLLAGPRVKLKSREMTVDDVFAGLSRSLKQLDSALRGAWGRRPEGDEETETMLRDALSMTEQLEREVKDILGEKQTSPRTGESKDAE